MALALAASLLVVLVFFIRCASGGEDQNLGFGRVQRDFFFLLDSHSMKILQRCSYWPRFP